MSRIGKRPIPVPAGVTVTAHPGAVEERATVPCSFNTLTTTGLR